MKPLTRHGTGQTGEYLVAAEFARNGFTVALPTGNAESVDILAYGNGQKYAIQVKTAGRGNHQFDLGRYVDVVFEKDNRQKVVGARRDLDAAIIVFFVFLGEAAGQDEFVWTTLGEFAKFLADEHAKYLIKHGGKRPGKNPLSLHSSITRKRLQEYFPHRGVHELLWNPGQNSLDYSEPGL